MKKTILMVAVMMASAAQAQADGFVCSNEAGDLSVKVYNNTQAEEGTRNAHVMILSNPTISSGRRTIARFQADNELLSNYGATYVADIDLRYNDSNRGGEYIGGTRLGYVDTITLDVDFSYGAPVEAGDMVDGKLIIKKRDGSKIRLAMTCERYLAQ